MGLNTSLSLLSFTVLLVFSTAVTAENITRAFEKYSNFSNMSDLFIKTKLTALISKYQTITVLAVNNDAISSIINKSEVELRSILMTHVILDYYDELKLQGLKEKSIMLTTLYQTTLNAEYVKTIYHNPYNLSIIEITMPIVAPGLSLAIYPPPPPPVPLAPAPAPSPMDDSMAPVPSPMDDETAPGPADENNPSDTPFPQTPPAPETPAADSPAPVPTADNEKIEAADKAGSTSSAGKACLSFDFILLLAFLLALVGSKMDLVCG